MHDEVAPEHGETAVGAVQPHVGVAVGVAEGAGRHELLLDRRALSPARGPQGRRRVLGQRLDRRRGRVGGGAGAAPEALEAWMPNDAAVRTAVAASPRVLSMGSLSHGRPRVDVYEHDLAAC